LIVAIEGLTKVYEGKQPVVALNGIDLQVERGEIFGLLGPNGAGKTTTIGICTTRTLPTSGRVRIAGIDVVAHPSQARRFIGVVPQFNTLDRSLTIYENIYFHCRYFGFSHPDAKARSNELLAQFLLSAGTRHPISSPAGLRNGCRLPAPSRIGRPYFFWTSQARGSIRRAASPCGQPCRACARMASPSC